MRRALWSLGLAAAVLAPSAARADGCYTCEGARTYVRYAGEDSWAKRHKAEACGCKITGTTSRCDGSAKVLCSVVRSSAPPKR